MKCDIYEEGENYIFMVDVPGYSKSDISIDIHRGYLIINAVSNYEKDKEVKSYIKKERFYGTVRRQFYVGDVDDKMIKASFNDGVLKVVVPKNEDNVSKRKIKID